MHGLVVEVPGDAGDGRRTLAVGPVERPAGVRVLFDALLQFGAKQPILLLRQEGGFAGGRCQAVQLRTGQVVPFSQPTPNA